MLRLLSLGDRCLSRTSRPVLVGLGLVLVTPLTAGCADMLGLKGLNYDQEPPTDLRGAGGSEGYLGVGGGILPREEPPPSIFDEFPTTWSTDALISTAPLTSSHWGFWVHEPHSGRLLVYSADRIEPLITSLDTNESWDILLAVEQPDGPYLLGYEHDTGLVHYGVAPLRDDELSMEVYAGTAGWTHLVVLPLAEEAPLVVSYDATDGSYRLGPANPSAQTPAIVSGEWPMGIHTMTPAYLGDQAGLLRLYDDERPPDFVAFAGGGFTAPTLVQDFPTHASEIENSQQWSVSLVSYDPDSGATCLGELDHLATFLPRDCVSWREGITTVAPLVIGEQSPSSGVSIVAPSHLWALVHSSDTGVVDLRRLERLEQMVIR